MQIKYQKVYNDIRNKLRTAMIALFAKPKEFIEKAIKFLKDIIKIIGIIKILIVSLVFVTIFLIALYIEINRTDTMTAVCYFYSTLAQSMAALVALYGIFVVFQWQVLEQKINVTYEALKNFIKMYFKFLGGGLDIKEIDLWLEKDLPSNFRRLIADANENDSHLLGALSDYYLQLNEFHCFKSYLYNMVLCCTAAPLILLFISITALTILPHYLKFFNAFRYPFCPLVAYLFYWQVRLILKTLKGPQPIQINNSETNYPPEEKKKFSRPAIEDIINKVLKDREINHKPWKAEI